MNWFHANFVFIYIVTTQRSTEKHSDFHQLWLCLFYVKNIPSRNKESRILSNNLIFFFAKRRKNTYNAKQKWFWLPKLWWYFNIFVLMLTKILCFSLCVHLLCYQMFNAINLTVSGEWTACSCDNNKNIVQIYTMTRISRIDWESHSEKTKINIIQNKTKIHSGIKIIKRKKVEKKNSSYTQRKTEC